MENIDLEQYLADMAEMSIDDFRADRNGELKAIDKLRLFYASAYIAKQN